MSPSVPSPSAPTTQTLKIVTRDERVLAATYYPATDSGVAVLISGATGVPRRYYDIFARHLAGRGLAVLTYDYRGIGDSHAATGTIEDWGRHDLAAAIEQLARLHGADRLALVAHSVGGQILGLAENIGRVRAAVLIAAQSGYWRYWRWPRKARMWLFWWLLIPVLSMLFRRFPGSWIGTADLPAAIARSWARWGRSPHYVCDARGGPLRPYNDHVTFPIRWLSFSDDRIAPFEAVEALRSYYPHAHQERLHLTPANLGVGIVGHFGYFRKTTPAANWDAVADWLIDQA